MSMTKSSMEETSAGRVIRIIFEWDDDEKRTVFAGYDEAADRRLALIIDGVSIYLPEEETRFFLAQMAIWHEQGLKKRGQS